MLHTVNTSNQHIALVNKIRGENGIAQPLNLFLDLAVACKTQSNSDEILALIKGDKALTDRMSEKLKEENYSQINTEEIISSIFSIDENLRREIVSLILEEYPLGESYAAFLQHLFLSNTRHYEGMGIPETLNNLLVDIVSQPQSTVTNLVLCGDLSPEVSLVATNECQVTQFPTTNERFRQRYLKLLYLADRKMSVIEKTDASLFHPEIPFDAGILADPFRANNYKPQLGSKKYSRLSSELIQAESVMKRVNGRLVCLVPNGILSMTTGDDILFKKELLKSNRLEAVIQLPERLLSATAIPVSLLVINTKGGFDKVTMIDARSKAFYLEASRTDRKLVSTAMILSMLQGETSSFKEVVSTEQILNESTNLLVGRYMKTDAQKKAEEKLAQFTAVELQDIADIRVCQMIKAVPEDDMDEDTVDIQQISQQNIDQMGQIDTSEVKTLTVANQETRINNQRLQHGDIIFTTKGIIGICGLVDETAVDMIPNQSFAIIRLKYNPYYASQKALFLYLRSMLCSILLEAKVTGAAMKVIKAQDIKMLKIPIIPDQDQKTLEKDYQELLVMDEQRKALDENIQSGLNRIWPT